MIKKYSFLFSFAIALISASDANSVTAIRNSGNDHPNYICNFALVNLGNEKFIKIHSQPKLHSRLVARIDSGSPLYICDEVRGWVKVYFSGPCNANIKEGIRSSQAVSRCKSGWTKEKSVTVVSG